MAWKVSFKKKYDFKTAKYSLRKCCTGEETSYLEEKLVQNSVYLVYVLRKGIRQRLH